MEWTTEYCGLTHLGELSNARRATVTRIGSHFELSMWFRGCGFNPPTKMFYTAEEARHAGEIWVAHGASASTP